ncbi:MAG: aldehyde dehydrogenase family protein [Alistipes sp.]|nr:aldehyde dehydrogenase family protein [Alistipes sp.]
MENMDIKALVEGQREYFSSRKTKGVGFRLRSLDALRGAILEYERDIYGALWEDLHKSEPEAYLTELSIVLQEIACHRKNLRKWSRPRRVPPSLATAFSRSRVLCEPLGVSLIISPFNYPVHLSLNPLVGAISSGCCAVVKTSREVPHTSAVLARMIRDTFDPRYIAVVEGAEGVNEKLLGERFDFIFFTGSTRAGKSVMEAASKNLTPVLLELGGKSPCIVDRDADIKIAAKRIAWGKAINAGQTCIAPDYLFVHKDVKAALIGGIISAWEQMYGKNIAESPYFPRIVNGEAVERLAGSLAEGKVVYGGVADKGNRYFSPTIMEGVGGRSAVMQQEIFGPILPVMEFERIGEATGYIAGREKPLALYYFGKENRREVFLQTSSGGGCIDDTLMHIANHRLPFGGVGFSGMGKYHGRESFLAFSNRRAVVRSPRWFDPAVKYPPFEYFKFAKRFL